MKMKIGIAIRNSQQISCNWRYLWFLLQTKPICLLLFALHKNPSVTKYCLCPNGSRICGCCVFSGDCAGCCCGGDGACSWVSISPDWWGACELLLEEKGSGEACAVRCDWGGWHLQARALGLSRCGDDAFLLNSRRKVLALLQILCLSNFWYDS